MRQSLSCLENTEAEEFMEKWVVSAKKADFQQIANKFGIDPVVARLIRNREQITDEEIDTYLHGKITELHSWKLLKGMESLLDILTEKIKEQKKIRIIGDYDIDGVCSTYILLKGLKRAGAAVDVDIPDRMKDGYGISRELIDLAKEAGTDTIITCDNGISAIEQIAYAKELGMTVLVTDHHEVPYEEQEDGSIRTFLPDADAIVNPKQEDCGYPFKGICGGMVAFKVICGLYEKLGIPFKEAEELIPFAAIATVGDVMDLVDENRILVKDGLRRLQNPENEGLKALIRVNNLENREITAYHIGFVLGPCMNASGRLSTAKRALQLLLSQDVKEASVLAEDLKNLNDSRKDMTAKGVEQAVELVETTDLLYDRVLVIYLPDCHESLAGLVAGRVRENYYRPVFVLTDSEDGVKGSGRSIESYSMYEELTGCGDLLTKFGGHPMAAGLSLDKENVEKFKRRLNDQCTLSEEELTEKVVIDMELPFAAITEHFIEELEYMEPFGKGNTKPVFAARGVVMQHVKIIGKNKNVAKATAIDAAGNRMEAICFHDAQEFAERCERNNGKMSITFYPGINEFRGERQIQIVITHYR